MSRSNSSKVIFGGVHTWRRQHERRIVQLERHESSLDGDSLGWAASVKVGKRGHGALQEDCVDADPGDSIWVFLMMSYLAE